MGINVNLKATGRFAIIGICFFCATVMARNGHEEFFPMLVASGLFIFLFPEIPKAIRNISENW